MHIVHYSCHPSVRSLPAKAIGDGWEDDKVRFIDDVNPGANVSVNGDLAIQGLTVRFGFGF